MTYVSRGFLADCEKEKLQASGHIQAYGALVILDAKLAITHFSENFTDVVALKPEAFVDLILQGLLLPGIVSLGELPGTRINYDSGLETDSGLFDLVLTRGPDLCFVIELFLTDITCPEWEDPPDMSSVQDLTALSELRHDLVSWIARISGFDRVMYYQFLELGDGEVIAEVCKDDSRGKYLGLRFPASDIPQIARNIYLKNPWRVIYDAADASVPVLGTSTPDLTWSDLRSVSPVHAVYMQNMGDCSSLSFPIKSGTELHALISCHGNLPLRLPLARLTAMYEVVRSYNRVQRNVTSCYRVRLVDEIAYNTQQLLKSLSGFVKTPEQWHHFSQWLLKEFEADAVVWCRNSEYFSAGISVEKELLEQLDGWFIERCEELVFFENSVRNLLSAELLTHIAGAAGLRIRLSGDSEISRLYLFRSEQVEEVLWGGNPNKPVEYHDGVLGIAPRYSFGKWVEKRIGFSRPWGSETRLRLLRLRDEMQHFSKDLPGCVSTQGQANE